MPERSPIHVAIRPAIAGDVPAIAGLHAASWKVAYRGILTDAYLDGAVDADRLSVWQRRFAPGSQPPLVLLAHREAELLGLISLYFAAEPVWGTLIDNYHVLPALRGHGIGRQLWRAAGRETAVAAGGLPVHLWAYAANLSACAVYRKLGGRLIESAAHDGPDGSVNLAHRFAWDGASAMS